MTAKELIKANEYERVVIIEGYDSALIGVSTDNQAIYDYDKMVQCLIDNGTAQDYCEAVDFIEYNVTSLLGKNSTDPIIMNHLIQFEDKENA